MSWKHDRQRIRTLMADLREASDGTDEETDEYLAANKKLDDAIRQQPWYRQNAAWYQ